MMGARSRNQDPPADAGRWAGPGIEDLVNWAHLGVVGYHGVMSGYAVGLDLDEEFAGCRRSMPAGVLAGWVLKPIDLMPLTDELRREYRTVGGLSDASLAALLLVVDELQRFAADPTW